MKKVEVIWREILYQILEKEARGPFTQQRLAKEFGFSTSTVFQALKVPRQIGAIQASGRQFRVISLEKLLYFWGTYRRLEREIVYQTWASDDAVKIESMLPDGVVLGAFSAYRWHFKGAPAEYDRVYIYASSVDELRRRFPQNRRGASQLFVLKMDPWLARYGPATPWGQTFADLWNIPTWYAQEFAQALLERMKESKHGE